MRQLLFGSPVQVLVVEDDLLQILILSKIFLFKKKPFKLAFNGFFFTL